MIFYWVLFILIFTIQIFPVRENSDKIANIKLILSLFLLFVYGSIRVDFGNDYGAYEDIFDKVKFFFPEKNLSEYLNVEFAYILLNWFMPSFRLLILFLTALTCITYYFLFKNYVPNKYYWVGFLLMAIFGDMMIFFQFSGIRNAIAINIMIFSIPLIVKRRYIKVGILTFLAFLFHKSVVFFMPIAYMLATPKVLHKKDMILWSAIVLFLLMANVSTLLNLLAPIINLFFNKYVSYIDNVETVKSSTFILYFFVGVLFVLTIIILSKTGFSPPEYTILKLSLFFILSLLMGALNFRMSQYFAPYLLVSTTIVLKNVSSPIIKYSYFTAIVIYMLYAFFIVYMGNPNFPYSEFRSIFD